MHGVHIATPVTPPLFALGCVLRLGVQPAPIVLGSYPVGAGSEQAIPVLASAGGVAYFQ